MKPKYRPPKYFSTYITVGDEEYDDVTVELDYDDDRVMVVSAETRDGKNLIEYMNDEEIDALEDRLSDEANVLAAEFYEEYGDWLYQCMKEEKYGG